MNKQLSSFYLIRDSCVEISQGGTITPSGHVVNRGTYGKNAGRSRPTITAQLLVRCCEANSSMFTSYIFCCEGAW